MSTVDLLAGTVMDRAASLMNDSAKVTYTYTAQVPYLNTALQELQEYFQLHGISTTEVTSAVIQVNAGLTQIIFNGIGVPTLPTDLVEPKQLWERNRGIDPFIPMTKKEFLPHYLEGAPTSQFMFYVWADQKISFLPSTVDNDIKIDYVKQLFSPVVDQNSPINVINAATFLQFRSAALMAEYIERNQASANSLNAEAIMAMDRASGISIKGKQSIVTRRRPFRANYKRRGWFT